MSEVQEGVCQDPQTTELDGGLFYTDYAILRISRKLYLRVRFYLQIQTFHFRLERIMNEKIVQVLSMTEEQYMEMIGKNYMMKHFRTDDVNVELSNNLFLMKCKKFIIFKEYAYDEVSIDYMLIQTLSLNMEQFEKLISYHDFILTQCPNVNVHRC